MVVGTGVDLGDGIMGVDALSLESVAGTAVWFSALSNRTVLATMTTTMRRGG